MRTARTGHFRPACRGMTAPGASTTVLGSPVPAHRPHAAWGTPKPAVRSTATTASDIRSARSAQMKHAAPVDRPLGPPPMLKIVSTQTPSLQRTDPGHRCMRTCDMPHSRRHTPRQPDKPSLCRGRDATIRVLISVGSTLPCALAPGLAEQRPAAAPHTATAARPATPNAHAAAHATGSRKVTPSVSLMMALLSLHPEINARLIYCVLTWSTRRIWGSVPFAEVSAASPTRLVCALLAERARG